MSVIQDLRFGVRTLRRQWSLLAVAALSLGLGIGLNVAIFGLIYALLLRPPAVQAPDELVNIYNYKEGTSDLNTNSYQDYLDLREAADSFSDVVGHSMALANLEIDEQPTLQVGNLVTEGYFDMLGVRAHLGRTFVAEEHQAIGDVPVLMLEHGFWQSTYEADPEIVGKTVRLGGVDFEVVGVTPPGFTGLIRGLQPTFFTPAMMLQKATPMGEIATEGRSNGLDEIQWRGYRFLTLVGRLRDGVQLEEAAAEVETLTTNLAAAYPDSNSSRRSRVIPSSQVRFDPDFDGVFVPGAGVVLALVALVLLVACANLANMLLARANGRQREIAVRLSLGAGRGQLVRQLLTESVLLSLLGGVFGIAVAIVALKALSTLSLGLPIQPVLDLRLDAPILGYALATSLAAGLVFGLVPALQSARSSVLTGLKSADGGSSVQSGSWLGRVLQPGPVLVVVQVALSLVLLVGAGLLQRSASVGRALDLGFDAERLGVLTVDLGNLAGDAGFDRETLRAKWEAVVTSIGDLPEVEAVGTATRMPLTINVHTSDFFMPGVRETRAEPSLPLNVTRTTQGYFHALDLDLLQGRLYGATDTADTPLVAVVTQSMVDRFWPGESGLGKRFRVSAPDTDEIEVVGVVSNYKVITPGEGPTPMVHFSANQGVGSYGNVVYRSRGRAADDLQKVRQRLLAVEPNAFLMDATTMAEMRDTMLLPVRAGGVLVSGLSVLALVLATVGLSGLIAFWVSQRVRDLGIRMALGASRGVVLRTVLLRSLVLVGIGAAIGLALSVLLARTLRTVLLVPGIDPASFTIAVVVLVAAATLASLGPANRAASVDPMKVLRDS